jgi:lipopolysaccharide export system permease protein
VIALGGLAANSEIIAMQSAGVAPRRIGWAVIKAGLVLMVAVTLLDQFVVSPLQQWAHQRRSMAILGTGDLATMEGFWSRDGMRFINVRQMIHGRIPSNIDIYQFDERGRLKLFTQADRAETFDFTYKQWLLIGVRQRVIEDKSIVQRDVGSMRWESFLSPNQIQVLAVPEESLSVLDLYNYVKHLKNSRQLVGRYEMVFWQKITLPLTTGAMVLLAVPFVFGSIRSMSAGKMIMAGAITGLGLSLLKQVIENTGLVMGFNPILTVTVPLGLILAVAWVMLRRVD